MKKSHIIALVVIAVAIAIIMTTTKEASSYVTFDQAAQMASTGNHKSIHVVGELKKEGSHIVGMEKSADMLAFSFILVDDAGKEQKVYYNEPMPPDFTKSEKVVVIGHYQADIFIAEKILLKCPSKYQDDKLKTAELKVNR
jgi:cytochrome c-type biogenesis protein CcmE